jgi:hypothetical protein
MNAEGSEELFTLVVLGGFFDPAERPKTLS